MPVPPELLGPYGLLIGALLLIGLLLKDHKRADDEDRRQRDRAMDGWESSTTAVNRLAAAFEDLAATTKDLATAIKSRARRDATRRRSDDP